MTNAELITALRNCARGKCLSCKQLTRGYSKGCEDDLMFQAADALEAAGKLIVELKESNKMLKNTIDADKGVMLDRIRYLEAQMPKEGEWISVKDRLPEESKEYIVFLKMGTGVEAPDWLGNGDLSYVTSMYFKKEQMLWFDEYDESYNADLSLVDTAKAFHVTHWMPLPDAPKGEQE